MTAPATSEMFDHAYRQPLTPWGDIRVPSEIKALTKGVGSSLELGCGVGRFSSWVAEQGIAATALDWSRVAIEKAKQRSSGPDFRVGDVTTLEGITGPFDVAFDVGCFHCLEPGGMRSYAEQLHRVLAPRGRLLIWALDESPSDIPLSPNALRAIFSPLFNVTRFETSRRRIVASHWYWLQRV